MNLTFNFPMKQEVKQNTRTLLLGKSHLEYRLIKSRRKTVQIMIFPQGQIEVRAPLYASLKNIEEVILKKGPWIEKKLHDFKKTVGSGINQLFEHGSSINFLGEPRKIMIQKSVKNRITLESDCLLIYARNTETEYALKLFEKWQMTQARILFENLIEKHLEIMKAYNLKKPSLTIRKMRTRWGSCSTGGKISLNLELMKYPMEFIEYVVAHELSHMVEHNHSRRFYNVLDSIMPDWKRRKKLAI